MPSQYVSKLSPGTVTVTTTAETTCGTVGPVVYDLPNTGTATSGGQGVTVSAVINSTNGAGVTAATLRVRQGGLTGPVVGVAQGTIATPSVAQTFTIDELDTSRVSAQSGGLTYFVTIQFTGATGNATINECVISAQGS